MIPRTSSARLRATIRNPKKRPDVVTFTSSSTVRNFVALLGARHARQALQPGPASALTFLQNSSRRRPGRVLVASIGPVTSSTLRESGLKPDIQAKEFTIPGLVKAIARTFAR